MSITEHEHICTGPRDCRICGLDSGTRHPKWQRVEPGTVIPAGQPHLIEYKHHVNHCVRSEFVRPTETIAGWRYTPSGEWEYPDRVVSYYVDSSWRPPLELPTEPTWGIAITASRMAANEWRLGRQRPHLIASNGSVMHADDVLDFIPLTDEQVARIEAAR